MEVGFLRGGVPLFGFHEPQFAGPAKRRNQSLSPSMRSSYGCVYLDFIVEWKKEMTPSALHVDPGFTWTSAFTGGSFIALVGLFLRQIGPWRKQTTDASDKLIEQLNNLLKTRDQRLDRMEQTLMLERRMHFIEIRRLEAKNEAERGLDRHKFKNAEAALDSLLNILEMHPNRIKEAVTRARERRDGDRRNEQLESATIREAELKAITQAEMELKDSSLTIPDITKVTGDDAAE